MPIISGPQYPEVRAALDVTLTPGDLPDTTIQRGVFQGAAEDEITALDLTVPLDDRRVVRATTLLTASLLAISLPRIISDGAVGLTTKYDQPTCIEMAGLLRDRAMKLLVPLLPEGGVIRRAPPFFGIAPGYRGRLYDPFPRAPGADTVIRG